MPGLIDTGAWLCRFEDDEPALAVSKLLLGTVMAFLSRQ